MTHEERHFTSENRFKDFSPQKKLDLAMQLYYSAKELKRSAIKHFNPNWDSEKIEQELKRIFLHART